MIWLAVAAKQVIELRVHDYLVPCSLFVGIWINWRLCSIINTSLQAVIVEYLIIRLTDTVQYLILKYY